MNDNASHILFVDDETSILEMLMQLCQDEDWTCHFASSMAQAKSILDEQKIDLVLADVVMDNGDGIQLLSYVSDRYPDCIRLFLTAYAEEPKTIAALARGITQQIIPKPWIDQELKEIIHSALRQRDQQKKYGTDFQRLINTLPLLPAIPESYANVRACMTGDEVDIEKMAEFISQDVAISATLLRWANSALFGQRFQVDTVKRAIIVLGTRIVENLVLSETINRAITQKLPTINGFDLNKFKKHSMAAAVISRLLIKSLWPNDSEMQDRAFVAGLLHDCGKLVLGYYLSEQFELAIGKGLTSGISLCDAELATYKATHAQIGAFLTEWWALPSFIVNTNHWHHAPQSTPTDKDIVIAVHVANLLCYEFNYDCSAERSNRHLEAEYATRFYLNDEATEILKAETEKTIRAMVQ